MRLAIAQVPQGSLYPALYRLERQGWITGEWRASEAGREVKFYSLTRAGKKRLETEIAQSPRCAASVRLGSLASFHN